jgi:hypothetical protein
MPSIQDELKARLSEAQNRMTENAQKLQQVQQEFSSAQIDYNVWRAALEAETRKAQDLNNAPTVDQPTSTGIATSPAPSLIIESLKNENDEENTEPSSASESMNKTEIIRGLLRQNPGGLTPPQIWSCVSAQFKHRPYMYSVLKRLKDRDEISFRRNKYVYRQVSESSGPAISL